MTDVFTIGIEAETGPLERLNRELDKFEQNAKDAAGATDRLGREQDQASKKAQQASGRTKALSAAKQDAARAAESYAQRLGPVGSALVALGPAGLAAGAAIGGITVAMRASIRVATEFDRINNTLLVATGGANEAQRAFEFLQKEADRLGLNIQSAGLQFAKLSAAARGTALEGEGARRIFRAVAEASTALGLSADQTGGALTAIEQMISKGTVSAEELRGQLGERLPGAFQIAARAMDVTTEELGEMLQKGEITAAVMLPKLARELENTFGSAAAEAASEYAAVTNRLSTEMDLLLNLIGQGAQDGVTPVLATLTDAIRSTREALEEDESGGLMGALHRFIKTGGTSVPGAALRMGMAMGSAGEDFSEFIPEAMNAELALRAIEHATEPTSLELAGLSEAIQLADEVLEGASGSSNRFSAEVIVAEAQTALLTDALAVANEVLAGTKSSTDEAAMSAIEYAVSLQRVADGTLLATAETQNLDAQLAAFESGGVAAYEAVAEAQRISNRITTEGTRLARELHISAEEGQLIVAERIAKERELERQLAAVNAKTGEQGTLLADVNAKTSEQVTLMSMLRGAAEEAGRAIQRSLADAFRDLFDGNIRGFRDFFGSVVDIAKNAAAQVAAQFAFQNIVSFARGRGGVGLGTILSGASGAASAAGGGGGIGGLLASGSSLLGGLGPGLGFGAGGAFASGGGGLAQILGLGSQVGIPGGAGSGFVASGLGTLANYAGVGGLGALGGGLLSGALGLNQTGGSIGGGAGAALGFAFGGPLGALAGGALGSIAGGFLGGKSDKGSFQITGSGGFAGGLSATTAFGTFGLSQAGTDGIDRGRGSSILATIAQIDNLIAGSLSQEQVAAVSGALARPGIVARTGRGNKFFEQAFGKAIADRLQTIFNALGLGAGSVSRFARNDGTAGSATASQVLSAALPALAAGLGVDPSTSNLSPAGAASQIGGSTELLGDIGTELIVGNQIQQNNGRVLESIRDGISDLNTKLSPGNFSVTTT